MDLERTVCAPRGPNCHLCPLKNHCMAYNNNSVKKIPPKAIRPNKPHYYVAVGVIRYNNKILIARRIENGFLGGLWEFPGGKIIDGETAKNCIKRETMEELGISVAPTKFIKQIQHEYTHFSITLDAYFCDYLSGSPRSIGCADWKWIALEEIYKLPFPRANHKLFGVLMESWNSC